MGADIRDLIDVAKLGIGLEGSGLSTAHFLFRPPNRNAVPLPRCEARASLRR